MATHYLKTVQPYFGAVRNGQKRFEVRVNDRDFKVGDVVYLQEYDPTYKYSGLQVRCKITYVLSDYPAIQPDHVVFSFQVLQFIEGAPHT